MAGDHRSAAHRRRVVVLILVALIQGLGIILHLVGSAAAQSEDCLAASASKSLSW